jgi:hypothetical protein
MEQAASQLIKIYTQSQFLMGHIYYTPTPEARLLDDLNGMADRGPVKKGKFLELNDVTIQYQNGKTEKLKVTYINKATVQLAVTIGGADSGRGIGAQKGYKAYPFVEKSPTLVRVETHDYIVTGNIYRLGSQKVWNILEDTATFLPLTHAQVHTLANGALEMVSFVALNKDHILSLQEENGKQKKGGAGNGTNPKSVKQAVKS